MLQRLTAKKRGVACVREINPVGGIPKTQHFGSKKANLGKNINNQQGTGPPCDAQPGKIGVRKGLAWPRPLLG